jgi:hypothetical protein
LSLSGRSTEVALKLPSAPARPIAAPLRRSIRTQAPPSVEVSKVLSEDPSGTWATSAAWAGAAIPAASASAAARLKV